MKICFGVLGGGESYLHVTCALDKQSSSVEFILSLFWSPSPLDFASSACLEMLHVLIPYCFTT